MACMSMSKQRVGALIVFERYIGLGDIINSGEVINANISQRLIENIFFKNSPLHDGAMVISHKRIKAAGCILPVSHNEDIPRQLGLRHRAALGITQKSDALAITVSEETGEISAAFNGKFHLNLSGEELERLLAEFYEGNTTESQEEALRDYFRTTEVPEHLQKDKEIFLSLNQGADRDVEVPAGLGDKLSRLIDEKAEEEQRFFRPNKSRRNWRWIGSVAATILVIIGIGYGVENLGKDVCPPTPQDTFSDPEEAYQVLQATLIEVSTNLNQGIAQVKETQMDMKKVNQEVKKEMQR